MTKEPQSQVFKMPSGAELRVGVAGFLAASELMTAVLNSLKGMALKPEDLKKDLEEIKKDPNQLGPIMDKLISVATSPEIRKGVFACASSAKYTPVPGKGEISVDEELFDDPEYGTQAREDFYPICLRIIEVNVKPFFAKAFSGFMTPRETSSSVPA